MLPSLVGVTTNCYVQCFILWWLVRKASSLIVQSKILLPQKFEKTNFNTHCFTQASVSGTKQMAEQRDYAFGDNFAVVSLCKRATSPYLMLLHLDWLKSDMLFWETREQPRGGEAAAAAVFWAKGFEPDVIEASQDIPSLHPPCSPTVLPT